MRHDPIELESSIRRRDHRLPVAAASPAGSTDDGSADGQQRPEQIVDAAFAALGNQLARVEKVFGPSPDGQDETTADSLSVNENTRRQHQALVANVVTQLEALERQRERLSQVLADVDD